MRKEIALTALAMVPFSISHANDAELVGIVTADILNVRSGPSSNEEVLFDVKGWASKDTWNFKWVV